jgi:ribosomal protein L11 methyltransferase
MKTYPAVHVRAADPDLLYFVLDDFAPTAIEERDDGLRAFFSATDARDAAMAALSGRFDAESVDVDDEDWARRSQEGLAPVTVGRLTIVPSRGFQIPQSTIHNPQSKIVVIQPSMGFGTGHHATTRLCLAALQELDVTGAAVLDAGTGSGILAIAAAALGAAQTIGIDVDADAIAAARDNLVLNPGVAGVTLQVGDLASTVLPPSDVVMANLTGALLVRSAAKLLAAARSGGTIIVSGLLRDERDRVRDAFAPQAIAGERVEDEWVGLIVKKS